MRIAFYALFILFFQFSFLFLFLCKKFKIKIIKRGKKNSRTKKKKSFSIYQFFYKITLSTLFDLFLNIYIWLTSHTSNVECIYTFKWNSHIDGSGWYFGWYFLRKQKEKPYVRCGKIIIIKKLVVRLHKENMLKRACKHTKNGYESCQPRVRCVISYEKSFLTSKKEVLIVLFAQVLVRSFEWNQYLPIPYKYLKCEKEVALRVYFLKG